MDYDKDYVPESSKLITNSGNSIYKLVNMAARRALEVAEGAPKLVENAPTTAKPTTIALEEISEGKVKYAPAEPKKE